MELPDINHDLVRFTAQRLANLDFKEWKALSDDARSEYKEGARRVLRAERRYFEKAEQEAAAG